MGRYEYFLFQYFRARNIGVFVLRTPELMKDLWDHVPPHSSASPLAASLRQSAPRFPRAAERSSR